MQNKKVILGMSGGIDSSVSAFLLREKGFEVIGITFKVFHCGNIDNYQDLETNCCSVEGIEDAVRVAQFLKIKHYTIDISNDFNDKVIKNFVNEYINGRTPNPCIVCNKEIKWGKLLKIANEQEAEYIATGHYARVKYDINLNRYLVSKGVDEKKDQSYALWRLSQEEIKRTLLPLGEYTKTRIREIARDMVMPVANKSESFEICFIPDNDYNKFLITNSPERLLNIGKGKIIYKGKEIGEHKGYPFYTIGQRRGLGVSVKQPLYVKNIYPEKNIIELGLKDEVKNIFLEADNINFVKYPIVDGEIFGTAKVRYKDSGTSARLQYKQDSKILIRFDEPKNAITPGQSAVFYEGEDIVAGGIITRYFD